MGTMFGFAFGGLNYKGPTSIPNLEVPVECTLNELYNGCTKQVTYTRTVSHYWLTRGLQFVIDVDFEA